MKHVETVYVVYTFCMQVVINLRIIFDPTVYRCELKYVPAS